MTSRVVVTNASGRVLNGSADLWTWLGCVAPVTDELRWDDIRARAPDDITFGVSLLDDGTTAHVLLRDERGLAHENALLRETLDAVDAAIVLYDGDLRFVLGNRGYHKAFPHLPPDCELVGLTYPEVLMMSIRAGSYADRRAVTDTEAFVAERTAAIGRRQNTVRNEFNESSNTWWQVRVAWTESDIRVALRVDITPIKRLEAELVSSQRVKTVGQISSGVAHHFNNLLTVIHSNLEMMLAGGLPPSLAVRARRALAGTEQGGRLTQQLLTFAQRDISWPQRIDPACFLSGIRDLLQGALGPESALELELDTSGCEIDADPAKFEAAMMNLVLNARDAIGARPEGANGPGCVSIRAICDRSAGACVITVTDNGVGMTAEIAAEAFEPFFSTKAPGVASGLGLSQVQGFATGALGSCRVHSAPEQGCTVELRLPLVDKAAAT